MHIIEIPHTKRLLKFPEHMGEFSSTQYIDFCRLYVKWFKGVFSYHELLVRSVYELLGMTRSSKKSTYEELEKRNQNVNRMTQFVDAYFIEENRNGKVVKNLDLSFIDNKIPTFTIGDTLYHGPKEALLNIIFDEYLAANSHFKAYSKSGDENELNMLVASLYRPAKKATQENIFTNYDGDIREVFVETNVELRAQKISTVPFHIRYGIYLFFWACQNYIATAKDVEVEGEKVDFSVLFKKEDSGGKSIGMVGLLFSLSETKVFGNKKETGRELYWAILLRLVQNHLEAEQAKRKAKQHD